MLEKRLIKIYDLKDDVCSIKGIQKATLNTKDFGLDPENGLFGSPEWWSAIDKGIIRKREVIGRISRIYNTGQGNSFPEFQITDEKGQITSWMRVGNDNYYIEGKKIKLVCVQQKFKKAYFDHAYDEVVLEVWIEWVV